MRKIVPVSLITALITLASIGCANLNSGIDKKTLPKPVAAQVIKVTVKAEQPIEQPTSTDALSDEEQEKILEQINVLVQIVRLYAEKGLERPKDLIA